MKKASLIFIALFTTIILYSQPPQAFQYQSVVRDAAGLVLSNQNVSFQMSILEGSENGTNVYKETHDVITNELGLVALEIGRGTVVSGDFTTINWSDNSYFLQVEMDENGNSNYQPMGTSQLLSTPYAIHSGSTSDTSRWMKNNNNLFYNDGNVGIGTDTPAGILDIAGAYHFPEIDGIAGQVLQTDGGGILNWSDKGDEGALDSIVSGGPVTAADERVYIGMEMYDIQGSWNGVDCFDCSKVFDLEWGIDGLFDLGFPSGQRQHLPVTIYKNIDKASPQLLQKIATNSIIDEVKFKFYHEDPMNPGTLMMYYQIKLSNARVGNFHHNVYHRVNDVYAHMDIVTFYYETILIEWLEDNIEFTDDWDAGGGSTK